MANNTLKEKLETIIKLAQECLAENGEKVESIKSEVKHVVGTDMGITLKIINKIGDCDESDDIQSNVLDKRDREGRVLLCMYVSYKYFDNAWLTTGDIEKITSDLGVKIDISNVTKALKALRLYTEHSSVPKKGQSTPYRLNRKGIKRFEEIIHGKKD